MENPNFYNFIFIIIQVASGLFTFIFVLMPLIEEVLPANIRESIYGNYLTRERSRKLKKIASIFIICIILGIISVVMNLIPLLNVSNIIGIFTGWCAIILFTVGIVMLGYICIKEYLGKE